MIVALYSPTMEPTQYKRARYGPDAWHQFVRDWRPTCYPSPEGESHGAWHVFDETLKPTEVILEPVK